MLTKDLLENLSEYEELRNLFPENVLPALKEIKPQLNETIIVINSLCEFIDSLEDFDPEHDDPSKAISVMDAILQIEKQLKSLFDYVNHLAERLETNHGCGWLAPLILRNTYQKLRSSIRRALNRIKNRIFNHYLRKLYDEFLDWGKGFGFQPKHSTAFRFRRKDFPEMVSRKDILY